jgi:Spy/CpxP family protein refolding chaperone
MRSLVITVAFVCSVVAGGAGLIDRLEARSSQQSAMAGHTDQPTRRPPAWWKTPKYIQELKLTAEQSAELDRIITAGRAQMTADKEDLDRAESDFRQLMAQPNVPKRQLLQAAERLEMARYSIAKERTMMTVRIHSVLTPDQRTGLAAIAKRHTEAERDRQKQSQNQNPR